MTLYLGKNKIAGESYRNIGVITKTTYRQQAFDASLSNPIYGNSTTVQHPAYVVNIWKRTA